MKLIVSAGGSFGHINPALAIIKKFQEKEKNLEVLYIGTHNRMEKEIVPSYGIKYEEVEIYGFTKDIKRDIKNIGCIFRATKKCEKIMDEFKPDVVIGVGGYVTYPVIKSAHKKHVKVFLHEQNSIPGKSNKALAKYADLIGVTFKHSITFFKTKGKVFYSGHPCGAQALVEPKISSEKIGFSKLKKLVIIVAGSLGSGSLNRKMKDFLMSVEKENFQVLYITGKSHYEDFVANDKFPSNVKVVPYFEHLSGLMKSADLVVSRAGGATLYEIAALQIPSIIIPSPNVANNHQFYNAKEFLDAGAIEMVEESNFDGKVFLDKVRNLLDNKEVRFSLINGMKKLDINDSAELIYAEIKDLIK